MHNRTAELTTRITSALILGSAVLFITWWDPISFAVMCLLGGVILAREWWALTRQRSRWFIPFGVFYIGWAIISLIALRYAADYKAVFILFALVWAGDSAAYFVGKAFGRHKISPRISPGKSWEGLAGSALVTALLFYFFLGGMAHASFSHALISLFLGSLFALAGLAGDLFESSLKRHVGVKDSGTLIPGHGGLFDRVDALIACAIISWPLLLTSSLYLFFTGQMGN